jgi:fructose-1,6-bisphosphatase/inositol monophosphatase family enzyme
MWQGSRLSKSGILKLIEDAVVSSARYMVSATLAEKRPEGWFKADSSLVMNVDIESQRIIRHILGADAPVVAEEDESTHRMVDSDQPFFLIDPLDGTTSCRRFWTERGGQIGFGPLVGYVEKGVLQASAFYSVPQRTLFVAERGHGTFECIVDFDAVPDVPALEYRKRLVVKPCASLRDAAALVFFGQRGEVRVAEKMRATNAVDNIYRFGGFANDCCRLARGKEQIIVQYSVKPWDFTAVLFAEEAGLAVIVDPAHTRTPLDQWKVAGDNPLVIAPANVIDQVVGYCVE